MANLKGMSGLDIHAMVSEAQGGFSLSGSEKPTNMIPGCLESVSMEKINKNFP